MKLPTFISNVMGQTADTPNDTTQDTSQQTAKDTAAAALPAMTDVAFLQAVSMATMQLDEKQFEYLMLHKLDDLMERTQNFPRSDFSDHRLFAWCKVVTKTAGHFNIANKHMLENKGLFLDDPRYIQRFVDIVLRGLQELETRFTTRINGPADWIEALSETDAGARRNLAFALNYVGRFAYTFNYAQVYEDAVMPVLQDRFDISVRAMTIARLPFTDPQSRVLAHVMTQTSRLMAFLDQDSPDNYTTLPPKSIVFDGNVSRLVPILVVALGNLSRHDDILKLMQMFDLSLQDLAKKKLLHVFMPTLLAHYHDLGALCKVLDINRSNPESLTNIIFRTQINARMGRVDAARNSLMETTGADFTTFSDMSKVSRSVENLLPGQEQATFVHHAQASMARMAQRSVNVAGDENYVARTADLARMGREAKVFAEYNQAVSTMCETGELTPDTDEDTIRDGDKIVLFSMIQDRVSPVVLTPLLPILQRGGARFFNLIDDGMTNAVVRPWPASPRLSMNFEALIKSKDERNGLINDWTIDPQNRNMSCLGVNYYQGFYERISRVMKVYHLDWTLPHVSHFLDLWLRQTDRAIAALEGVRAVLEEKDARATLVSLQSQFVPYYALKQYAASQPHCFTHVTLSSSYENWASNMSGKPVSSLTLLNNTVHPHPSSPAFGRRDHFQTWFETDFARERDRFLKITAQMTGVARAGDRSPAAEEALAWIKAKRQEKQRRVFCALGKIPYDLAVPYQRGPAHRDIADWLNHTIDMLAGSDDLLLIKPHPHELNYEISHKPNERFIDLIRDIDGLPDNIRILPYRGLSVQDLMSVTDHFLCWNGSSISELGAQGASVIASDDWAALNYPVNVRLPDDRDHYAAMLRGTAPITMAPDFADRCAAYIAYMVDAPFAIPNPYVGRSSTNTNFNQAWINWDVFTPDRLRELEAFAPAILAAFFDTPPAP